jgi:hypothetical protein
MVGRVAIRVLLLIVGYLAGLTAGSAALPGILLIISSLVSDSEIFKLLGLGPFIILAAPIIMFYILWITLVLTFIPAVILNGLTEIFRLRRLWLHMLIAIVLALGAGLLLAPDWFSGMNRDRWLITMAIVVSAAIAGVVYWMIAGREAGNWRRPMERAQPS